MKTYLTKCVSCGKNTSKAYARKHKGECKACAEGILSDTTPTREQRILEHGYQAYALEEGHYDQGDF